MKYILPRESHQELYIFEGVLYDYKLDQNTFMINVSGVDYPDLPAWVKKPRYLDKVKIRFINFSYLEFETTFNINNVAGESVTNSKIILGSLRPDDALLGYGGVVDILGILGIPSSFTLDLVCQDIELELSNIYSKP